MEGILLLQMAAPFEVRSSERRMVPRAGIEPAHLAVRDFKSLVSTISPPGQVMLV